MARERVLNGFGLGGLSCGFGGLASAFGLGIFFALHFLGNFCFVF
jgi:hypothetical protein